MSRLNHKDVLLRATKTAFVAFLVAFVGSWANLAALPSLSVLQKLLVTALMAAGTALLNYAIQLLKA